MRIALGIPLPLNILTNHCEAFSKIPQKKLFTHITTDSREAFEGDLFFSLASDKSSAEEHINEARNKGALSVSSLSKEADFLVFDCQKTLLKLAIHYKAQLKSLKVTVAITGSVGKTTTKEFCASFLSASYKVHKTYMNYNNALGVSLSILSAPSDTEILILELGMNNLGEIRKLSDAIEPDYAVITNIGTAHIGNLGSRKLIAQAKLEISSGMTDEKIIVPYEEPLLSSGKIKISLSEKAAEYYLIFSSTDKKYTFFHRSKKIVSFSTSYKAYHHLNALLIALTLAKLLKLNENSILNGIENCEHVLLRQKLINFKNFSVFDDTYSSSYEAIKADIDYLKLEYPNRALSFALGDILELGAETVRMHKEVGRLIHSAGGRKLYAFGSYAYLLRDGAKEAGMNEKDITLCTETDSYKIIAEEIYRKSKPGEIVLIKASHALHSEKIIEEIERLDKKC